jgi:hypothetical protein
MIRKVECFACDCDNCGESFEDALSGFQLMADEQALDELLENNNWYNGEEGHFCPKCHKINDDDKLVINFDLKRS